MDKIYETLIERIPNDLIAEEVAFGDVWLVVKSSCGAGAASVFESNHAIGRAYKYEGRTLKELAMLIDSPVPVEKGISIASINAYYNQFDRLKELEKKGILTIDETGNSFVEYGQLAAGKDVAFVGHFCGLEMHMTRVNSISILEKRPQNGDLPAEMCDEILPGKDYVFMTGATLANNTATHLLELCNRDEKTKAIFVGPTTTLSEILLEFGAAELAGTIIIDPDAAIQAALSPDHMSIFGTGQKLRIIKA